MAIEHYIECHYTQCSVCGDGLDTITVGIPEFEHENYFVAQRSNCYGHQTWEFETAAEALAKLQDRNFLFATQRSIKKYKDLTRILMRHKRPEAQAQPIAEAARPAPLVNAPESGISVDTLSRWINGFSINVGATVEQMDHMTRVIRRVSEAQAVSSDYALEF